MNRLKLFVKICLFFVSISIVFIATDNAHAAMSLAGRLNLPSNAIIDPGGTLMTSGDFMYLTYSVSNNCWGIPPRWCTQTKYNYIAKIRISDFKIVLTKGLPMVNFVNGYESIDSNGEFIYLSADRGASLTSTFYPYVVKISTSTLGIVDSLQLNQPEEHGSYGAVIDKDNQYIYVTVGVGSGYTVPARIIKIRTSDLERMRNLDYSSSSGGQMMIDNNNQYLYASYGSPNSNNGVAKISLSSFSVVSNNSYNSGGEYYSINAINKDSTSGLFMGGSYGQLRKYSLLNFSGLGTLGIGSIGQYMQTARATIDKNDTYAYSVSKSYVTKINYSTMAGLENFTGFNSNDNVTGPVKIDSNCQYLYSGGYLSASFASAFGTGIVYKIATGDNCGGPPTVSLTASPTAIDPGKSSILTWTSTNASIVAGTSPSSFVATTPNGNTSVSPNATTTYTITVANAHGDTAVASAIVIVNQPPGKPVLKITTICNKDVPANHLDWTAVNPLPTSSWKYDVYRNKVLIGQSNSLSFDDTDVTAGQNYEYYVRAKNSDTIFTDSDKVSVDTKKCDITVSIDSPQAGYIGYVNQPISFSGLAVDHGDLSATITYAWNFGDGTGSGKTPTFIYTTTGQKTINLKATSSRGVVGDASPISITIKDPPPPPPAAFRGIFVGNTIT
ncbi:MAG: PKD domain-containing protein, partial [Sphingobacterium sp.]